MKPVSFNVDAASFHRLIYNGRLFDHRTPILLRITDRKMIQMTTCDSHVYLRDFAEHDGKDGMNTANVVFEPAVHRELELALRGMDGSVRLIFDGVLLHFGGDHSGTFLYHGDTEDTYGEMDSLLDFSYWSDVRDQARFAINPDRFRKFSLIKPGDFPLDFFHVYHRQVQRDLLLFRAGPTVVGAYLTLDREFLSEAPLPPGSMWPV